MNILNKRQTAKQATKQTVHEKKNLTMTVADLHKAIQAKECIDDDDFDDDGDDDDDICRLRQGYPAMDCIDDDDDDDDDVCRLPQGHAGDGVCR